MKCIKCGKEQYADSLCKECYSATHSAVKGFKDFAIEICAACGAYSYTKAWKPRKGIKNIVKEALKKNTKFIIPAEKFEVELELPEHQKNGGVKVLGKAFVHITSLSDGVEHEEDFEVPVEIKYTVCTKCGKAGTQYYEGILQLRGDQEDIDIVADFLLNEVDKVADRGIFINKEEKVKGGYDFYLTSNKYLQQLGKKLFQRFGGEMKVSPQLFTRNRQTSKDVYRLNVLIRLPDFKVGDILLVRKKLIKVENIAGHHILGIDLKSLSQVKEDYSRNGYEIKATEKDIKKVQVSLTHPHIEVLHPETYQSVQVENPIETEAEEVEVVIIDDKVWLV